MFNFANNFFLIKIHKTNVHTHTHTHTHKFSNLSKKISFFCILLTSFIFTDCKIDIKTQIGPKIINSNLEYYNLPISTNTIKFKGIDIKIPEGYKSSDFDLNDESFFNEYYGFTKNGRVSFQGVGSILDEIDLLTKKLPYLPDLNDLKKDKALWNSIKNYFPTIKNSEEARKEENFDAIVSFYNILLRIDLAKLWKQKKANRLNATNDLTINELEASNACAYPIAAKIILDAKNTVDNEWMSIVGGNTDGASSNAFRHACWNALSVQRALAWGYSRDNSVEIVRKQTTAREQIILNCFNCPDRSLYNDNKTYTQAFDNLNHTIYFTENFDDIFAVMDLANNLSGRTYTKLNTSWGIFGLRNYPSEYEIKTHFQSIANDVLKCPVKTTIPDILGIDSKYNKTNLGNFANCFGIHHPNSNRLVCIQ